MYTGKEKKNVFLNIETNRVIENSIQNECMFTNCNCSPISSHCIPKSMLERKLSDTENNLYAWNIKVVTKNLKKNSAELFTKQNIKSANTFPGFCKEHDNKIFKDIEHKNNLPNISLEEYSFLHAYRNLCYKLWEEQSLTTFDEERDKERYMNKVIETESNFLFSNVKNMTETFDNDFAFDKYNNLKNIFENFIDENYKIKKELYTKIKIHVTQLNNHKLYFSSMSCNIIENSNFPISMGIIPEFLGKPNIFYIISHNSDNELFNLLVENSKENDLFKQNIVLKSTTNTIIHPELFQYIKANQQLEKLINFISYTGLIYFDKYQGFNLFNYSTHTKI